MSWPLMQLDFKTSAISAAFPFDVSFSSQCFITAVRIRNLDLRIKEGYEMTRATLMNTKSAGLRGSCIVLAGLFVVIPVAISASGATQAPPPRPELPVPHNLQVLPKDITLLQLDAEMDRIAMDLGVTCDHCHAQAKLPPGVKPKPGEETFDFALDDKPAKKTARQMLIMLRTINAMVPVALGKGADQVVHVQCVTCHHGMPSPPRQLPEILSATTAKQGTAAAVMQFKDLRQKYFGGYVYDFSDGDVSDAATPRLGGLGAYELQLIQAGKMDEALVWLKVSFQYYPKSAANWALTSLAQQGKKDKDGAIKSAEKAIELAPQFTLFKGVLEQAKAMP